MNTAAPAPGVTYTIEGGEAGRERLRLVSRVLHESTCTFLDRVGLRRGQAVLDMGCGGGDVTREIARRVGASGRVTGVDADAVKLDIARAEAARDGLTQLVYRQGDAHEATTHQDFDLIYARFLLSHLRAPEEALRAFACQLRSGGKVAVEDLLFDDGLAAWPDDWAVRRYRHLVQACVRNAGGTPDVGARLPVMLRELGFAQIAVNVVQVLSLDGEAKLLPSSTMRAMRPSIVQRRLASFEEMDALIAALETYAARADTLIGTPRIVQVRARFG